jgi:hypothetical protein
MKGYPKDADVVMNVVVEVVVEEVENVEVIVNVNHVYYHYEGHNY